MKIHNKDTLNDNASTFSFSCRNWKLEIVSTRCHQENSKGDIIDWRPNMIVSANFVASANNRKEPLKFEIQYRGGEGEEYFLENDREV